MNQRKDGRVFEFRVTELKLMFGWCLNVRKAGSGAIILDV